MTLETVEGLWTPPKAKLAVPFRGRVRLQVGYPDHPDKGELTDTGWNDNSILPFLPYMTWSALNPFDSTAGTRFLDGSNVYPSWADITENSAITVTGSTYWGNISGATASTSPVNLAATPFLNTIGSILTSGLVIGNYNTAAPSGHQSFFTPANFTTYSLVRRFVFDSASNPGNADNVFFGPTVSSQSITGVAPPVPSTTISRTFTTQAGTVNTICFIPLVGASGMGNPGASLTYPDAVVAQVGGAGTSLTPSSFRAALSGTGDPFTGSGGVGVIATTFYIASSAVTIPTGAQLTMSYQISPAGT